MQDLSGEWILGWEGPGKILEAAFPSATHYLFPPGQAMALAAEQLACHKLLSLEQDFPKWLIAGLAYSNGGCIQSLP